jgi:hypothetical protein
MLNPKNDDNDCFKYCCNIYQIYKHYNKKDIKNIQRVSNIATLMKDIKPFNYDGLTFPVQIHQQVPIFEKNNNLKIKIYTSDDDNEPYIIYDTDETKKYDDILKLFYLESEEKSNGHFCYIHDFSALFQLSKHYNYCEKCNKKITKLAFKNHDKNCNGYNKTDNVEMPEAGETLTFKNFMKQNLIDCIVATDLECSLVKTNDKNIIQNHSVNSYAMNFITSQDEHNIYNICKIQEKEGENLMSKFIKDLEILHNKMVELNQLNKRLVYTKEINDIKNECKCCDFCKTEFNNYREKHAHHNHITGKFLNILCFDCNKKSFQKELIVFFHNGKNYDFNFIIGELMKHEDYVIDVIPTSSEKFISLSFRKNNGEHMKIRFLDSFIFMRSSLKKLSSNLITPNYENFKHTKKTLELFFNVETLNFDNYVNLIKKQYYPYSYINNFNKLYEEKIPTKDDLYDVLTKTTLTVKEYKECLDIYNTYKFKSFMDYHKLYLLLDVSLLSDCLCAFRKNIHELHGLDMCQYLSLASLTWDCCLKNIYDENKFVIELLSDVDMMEMFEKMKRGGFCNLFNKRHSKANNKYMKIYDETKQSTYIMYFDINNMYGGAMIEMLPYGEFKWVDKITLEEIINTDDENEYGYVIDCDIKIPVELQDTVLKDMMIVPYNRVIVESELSDYNKKIMKKNNIKSISKVKKLVSDYHDRTNYVCHYRIIKYIYSLGITDIKINKCIKFKQGKILESYIMKNQKRREIAKNEFEKNLYKDLNNMVFGNTIKNIREYTNVNLYDGSSIDKVRNKMSRYNVKSVKEMNGSYFQLETYKSKILYNIPVFIGVTILDISKIQAYNFHYNYICKTYDNKDFDLLYGDTDSLVYEIRTEDAYKDMKNNEEKFFDLSEMDFMESIKSNLNKKKLYMMKPECRGLVINEFLALAPKNYFYERETLDNVKEEQYIKKSKGVSKCIVKDEINKDDYVNVLNTGETKTKNMTNIVSKEHILRTINFEKIALTAYYDKSYLMDDGVHLKPYGYYKNKGSEEISK